MGVLCRLLRFIINKNFTKRKIRIKFNEKHQMFLIFLIEVYMFVHVDELYQSFNVFKEKYIVHNITCCCLQCLAFFEGALPFMFIQAMYRYNGMTFNLRYLNPTYFLSIVCVLVF